jgi:hypothetical protein
MHTEFYRKFEEKRSCGKPRHIKMNLEGVIRLRVGSSDRVLLTWQ